MVRIHYAYTSQINPEGASPVLTLPQIWQGLQRKIRFAQEFVPVIEGCEVLKEEDGVVTRVVKFKKGLVPKEQATEVVRGYGMSWVDFEQEDGTHVRNVISSGPGGPEDFHMTYMFEFLLPNISETDTEGKEKETARLTGMSKVAVESSIKVIREMVQDGRIPS
ncbi:hypothetical protein BCR34DRAFT_676960 [Clohesyomyces aquaticus]|uniref:DUF1857-domain-containing protein n=1 Tax=Clohesyomyces aquaticus TaxID=1231657 RepID=A0A1Y1YKI4_9PLEO|nr:hypothetical protein BCR34DRAFT_676960 [Clohesyomyces aquaticus]